MRRPLQALLIAASLLAPTLMAYSSAAYADPDPPSEGSSYEFPLGATVPQPLSIPSSGGSAAGTVKPFSGQVASSVLTNGITLALRPDLQTRILDQAGPHDPTIYPPEGPQQTVGLGLTEDLTLQVRNASGLDAANVEVEIWLTGFLDAGAVLSASNGFTCTLDTPVAHMIFCKGGALKAGGWDTAANIILRARGASTGKGVVVATVNPNHTTAESDDQNDQDARWISVLPVPPSSEQPSAIPPVRPSPSGSGAAITPLPYAGDWCFLSAGC